MGVSAPQPPLGSLSDPRQDTAACKGPGREGRERQEEGAGRPPLGRLRAGGVGPLAPPGTPELEAGG